MSKSTISTFQLRANPRRPRRQRLSLEARLWPQGPRRPVCRSCERITARTRGFYRCNACKEDFTVRTGTIFERSHVPLHKWVYAMYLLLTARKGISSMQLAKEIGITQKSLGSSCDGFAKRAGVTLVSWPGPSKSMKPMSAGSRRISTSTRSCAPVVARSARRPFSG